MELKRMKGKNFIFIEHTADIKFQAFGKDVKEVFENSSLALKETICGRLNIKEKEKKKIQVKGNDFESLLYNFLEEFLYLLDAKNFLISKLKTMKIDEKNFKINAVVSGDKASGYDFINNVKAVTYSDMLVKKQDNRWVAQVVLDV